MLTKDIRKTIDNARDVLVGNNDRSFIKEIHVIKYKTDGNVDWNIKLYDANTITDSVPQNIHKDVSKLIKIKTPNGNVVDLFDRD